MQNQKQEQLGSRMSWQTRPQCSQHPSPGQARQSGAKEAANMSKRTQQRPSATSGGKRKGLMVPAPLPWKTRQSGPEEAANHATVQPQQGQGTHNQRQAKQGLSVPKHPPLDKQARQMGPWEAASHVQTTQQREVQAKSTISKNLLLEARQSGSETNQPK